MSSIRQTAITVLLFCIAPSVCQADGTGDQPPNFILVFVDDLGYGDLGCYGNTEIRTPHLDQMATEGMRFTSFYAQTVCGPSRASLMTGCYPLRVAQLENREDIHPWLHTEEITLAEILQNAGYATGCFGKWDLAGHKQVGFAPELMPTRQGFDTFFGTPTSNDRFVNLFRDEELVEERANMATLTRRYTDAAIEFITEHRDEPFFAYLPYTMPHTRLAASEAFRGKSPRGLYGDVVEELDFSVGRLLETVTELGIDDRTWVLFISDNGPWHIKRENGGSAGPLRGAKTSSWEGGFRVPCIIRAPGRVPAASVCDNVVSTLDLLPTLTQLADSEPPTDRVIDGRDVTAILLGDSDADLREPTFFFYTHVHLQAVRSGKWKLHLPRPARPPWMPNWAGHVAAEDVFEIEHPMLFDLEADLGESTDVAKDHPDVVSRLLELAEQARTDIGDYNRVGQNARSFDSQPLRPAATEWGDQ